MLSRLKFDLSDTISTMLEYIPESMWVNTKTTFCDFEMGGGQFITAIVNKLKKYGHSDENIQSRVYGFSENELYLSYIIGGQIIGTFDIYKEKKHSKMKFDVIVGNPPYQLRVGPNKTEPIWDKFVKKSFNHLKENGYLSLIHPAGWRNIEGRFKDIQELLTSKKIVYLEIHNENDGIKTFGAETRFDWYVLQNTNVVNNITKIKFQSGNVVDVNTSNIQFIPNDDYKFVKKLIATDTDERVSILYSSSVYETRNKHTSNETTAEFKYPCVYTITSESVPTFFYSSINTKGHFGIPKLIWSNGRISSVGSYIDKTGEFGLTQFAYALVDNVEILPLIKQAFDSPKFRKLMENCAVGQLTINYKLLSTFRKDFWKEFI
jgi:hypothetical protein